MTPQDLLQLVAKGESETLEIKSSVPAPEEIARQIATLANTNGGLLVLGIKEPAQVVGVNPHRAKAMISASQRYLSPSVAVDVESITVNGHPVVVASVKPEANLIAASGGYYRRVGERIRPMKADEIRAHASTDKSDSNALSTLSSAVAAQTQTIDQLRLDFNRVNSFPRKIGIGLIGASAGVLLKYLADIFF